MSAGAQGPRAAWRRRFAAEEGCAVALTERLRADMIEAMRARADGRLRLSVLRMVIADVRNAEIAQGNAALDDAGVLAILQRQARQRHDALEGIRGRGRPEAERQLHEELAVLSRYLPEPLSPEAVEAAVRAAIAAVGAAGPGDFGRVMAAVLPQVRGRADGATVSAVARRLLAGS